jgi:hypothetical protein
VGGGLIRSLGGWAQVLSLRWTRTKVASDARILGSGAFVAQRLAEAGRRERETLRLSRKGVALANLGRQVIAGAGGTEGELRAGGRSRGLVRAQRFFCQVAVKGLGYSGAEVGRFLGVR